MMTKVSYPGLHTTRVIEFLPSRNSQIGGGWWSRGEGTDKYIASTVIVMIDFNDKESFHRPRTGQVSWREMNIW